MAFKQYTEMIVREIGQVFDRMDEASVRPLLEAIKSHDRIFLWEEVVKGFQRVRLPCALCIWVRKHTGFGMIRRLRSIREISSFAHVGLRTADTRTIL